MRKETGLFTLVGDGSFNQLDALFSHLGPVEIKLDNTVEPVPRWVSSLALEVQ